MRAVQITEFGGPEVLQVVELPDPEAGDGLQVLTVDTAGVNYADTHQGLFIQSTQVIHAPRHAGAQVKTNLATVSS